MTCLYAEFEIADGAQPRPYYCPACKHPILAPPRRDTKSELLTSWLQLAQGVPIDVPDKIEDSVFDEYFAKSVAESVAENDAESVAENGYVSEEV